MQKTDDVFEIDLKEMISALWAKAWIIAICGVVMAIGCFIMSKFFMSPIYCSTAKIYVMTKTTNQFSTYNDVALSTYLSMDYVHLVKSRDVLEKVIADCNLEETYNSLAGRIVVENPTDTRILTVAVSDTDPAQAQMIATEVCAAAAEHMKGVMNLEGVNVAEKANLPIIQSSPSVKKWTMMGMLAGMFLCAGVVVLKVLLDDTIKSREDVERYLGLSTLALIPLVEESEETKKTEREVPEDKEEVKEEAEEVKEENAAEKEEA